MLGEENGVGSNFVDWTWTWTTNVSTKTVEEKKLCIYLCIRLHDFARYENKQHDFDIIIGQSMAERVISRETSDGGPANGRTSGMQGPLSE